MESTSLEAAAVSTPRVFFVLESVGVCVLESAPSLLVSTHFLLIHSEREQAYISSMKPLHLQRRTVLWIFSGTHAIDGANTMIGP